MKGRFYLGVRVVFVQEGRARALRKRLARFTLIGAATEEGMLPPRFARQCSTVFSIQTIAAGVLQPVSPWSNSENGPRHGRGRWLVARIGEAPCFTVTLAQRLPSFSSLRFRPSFLSFLPPSDWRSLRNLL